MVESPWGFFQAAHAECPNASCFVSSKISLWRMNDQPSQYKWEGVASPGIFGYKNDLYISQVYISLPSHIGRLHFPASFAITLNHMTGMWPMGCEKKVYIPFPGLAVKSIILLMEVSRLKQGHLC